MVMETLAVVSLQTPVVLQVEASAFTILFLSDQS